MTIPKKLSVEAELLAALKSAKENIKSWHNLSLYTLPKEYYDKAWAIYDEHAPEMQLINEAIRKAEKSL